MAGDEGFLHISVDPDEDARGCWGFARVGDLVAGDGVGGSVDTIDIDGCRELIEEAARRLGTAE